MTVVLRAVPVGGVGGGSSGTANAQNVHGEVSGLAPGATATLCTIAAAQWKMRGFVGFGDNDAVFWVDVDGVPLPGVTARASVVKVAHLILPNPEVIVGTTVRLRVRNEANVGTGVSGSFEGTLMGE